MDEIFIKQMSPIDAYNYGRQMTEKELNEIHLCECKQIKKDTIKDTLEELWKRAIYMHDDYVEYEELRNIIDDMLKENF